MGVSEAQKFVHTLRSTFTALEVPHFSAEVDPCPALGMFIYCLSIPTPPNNRLAPSIFHLLLPLLNQ